MKLASMIKKSAVLMEMKASSKTEAIEELVDLLCRVYRIKDRGTVLDAIKSRESKASTGIGMGLAVPHAKTAAVNKLHIAFGLSRGGIDFDSTDGEKAHLFFIMVSARDKTGPHIQALAGISRLIKHKEVRAGMLACGDAAKLLDFIAESEKKYK
jgi:fructose-specific phosphotransferase system IIA component